MQNSRTKSEAGLLVLVVFVLGLLVGGVGNHLWGAHVWGSQGAPPHAGHQPPPPMSQVLGLSPDQQKQWDAIFTDSHPQFEALRQKYLELLRGQPVAGTQTADKEPGKKPRKAKTAPPSREALLQKILVNMEEWRWMPPDLGKFYAWVNVPEFLLRVVKDGSVLETERVAAAGLLLLHEALDHHTHHEALGPIVEAVDVDDDVLVHRPVEAMARGLALSRGVGLRLHLRFERREVLSCRAIVVGHARTMA